MNVSTKAILLAAITMMMTLPAHAGRHGGDDIRAQLDRQQGMIDHGVDRGTLTRREASILRDEQRDIRNLSRSLRRDGYPPHESRRIIERKLYRAERHIRDLASNDSVSRHYSRRDGRSGHDSAYARNDDRRSHSSRH